MGNCANCEFWEQYDDDEFEGEGACLWTNPKHKTTAKDTGFVYPTTFDFYYCDRHKLKEST